MAAHAFYKPQPALSLNPPTLTSSTSTSSLSPSSSSPSRSPRSPPRRTSSHPALSSQSPSTLAPPPFHAPPSAFPLHVLTTPDPADAVPPVRRSVQLNTAGPVNWSRPIPSPSPTKTTTNSISSLSVPPSRPRRAMSHVPPRRDSSPATSSDDDIPTPTTPRQLPPGAAPAEPSWKGIGLGIGLPEFDVQVQVNRTTTVSSCSSTEGSLGGESVTTASSSSPSTPTRLLFVSETLNSLSYPTTLDELRTLRAKAAELDAESKRLRRLRGREPAQCPRLVPRKAVPVVSELDLAEKPAPKPRRPAVRHSLIVAPADPSFALLAEPLRAPPAARLPPSSFGAPALQASAARRPFYAQGKAAMSVIEFGTNKDKDREQPAPRPAPIAPSPKRMTSGTSFSLRREKSRPLAPAPLTIAPVPARAQLPAAAAPAPASPTSPKSPKSPSPKTSFLGKHKKLSRFLGKPQAA